MKSQKFGISRLPFRRLKQIAHQHLEESKVGDKEEFIDEEEAVDEEESVDEKEAVDGEDIQQTREEQLASIIQEEEVHSDGEDCELHVYERRFDTRGDEVFLRAGTKSSFMPPKRKSHRACLVLNRHFDREGQFSYTELEIQSRHIVKALRKVIGTYPGVDFTTELVTIQEPPRCIFNYQDELQQHAEASENDQLKSHIQLCLEYMEKTLHREIKIFKALMSSVSVCPEMEHRDLWMVFKPGCLLYEEKRGIESLLRLRSIHHCHEENSKGTMSSILDVSTERIYHRGSDIGLIRYHIKFKQYEGCKPLCELTAFPLHFHPEKERIRHDLLERGRKFLSHCGIHHRFYDGTAYMDDPTLLEVGPGQSLNVRHRIMIDLEQYSRSVGDSHEFISGTRVYHSGTEASSKLSDEDIMTCRPYLPGYSLEFKRWALFSVADITEVAYNDKAFKGLVLREDQKKLMFALLQRQDHQQDDDFDDLIQGKGKGLIFLLYGPPGVGKTYTAEGIADRTRRPLLKINSGELDGPGSWIEHRLAELLSLAARWNGITLLDEADVFMQERTLQTMESNRVVSILLRVLEYYEGILFLTTNRVDTLDRAFKSRIHLFIAYPPLSADARGELWTSSVLRANRGQRPEWLTAEFLDHLREKKVNGREIKNIVRVGQSLARNEHRDLKGADLLQGLNSLEQFETDLSKWSEQRKDADIKVLEDASQGAVH